MSPEASWTFEAVQSLVALAREGVPVSIISLKLKRSSTDVRAKLSDLGITPSSEA
jgi:Fe2+ transport system protein FeoA